ncbi:alcohol acetyltransferase [Cerioporus squamosus]|nr:alcohol acetyltransferase [Cerioporus squamosus]
MSDTEKTLEKQDAGASTSGRVLRKAGRFEHYFNARSRLKLTGYVTVCARYAHTSGTPLSKSVLFTALEDVIRKNVALAARFAPASPEGLWVALPAVDLNRVVEFVDKDREGLPTLLEELFPQPVDLSEDTPQWRLLVLRDGWVVFAYDHTIGDGQSGLAFHHNLLASLRSIHDSLSEHSGIVSSLPQDATLAPALEDATDTTVPFPMFVRELSKLLFPFLDLKKGKAWAGYPVQKPPTMVTTVRLLDYTPEQASSLVKLSRDHQATLTSTIHTLALIVLSRVLYAQPANKNYKYVHTSIPLSLRRITGTPPSAMCNHISTHAAYHPLFQPAPATISKETFPWDSASALTAALRSKLPHSAHAVGMFKYVSGKYDEYCLGMLGKPRRAALELSNVGAFPEPPSAAKEGEEARWRIQEMFFVQGDASLGAALKVNPVGTAVGGLGISITWGKGAVDDELAEAFVKAFDESLRMLAV